MPSVLRARLHVLKITLWFVQRAIIYPPGRVEVLGEYKTHIALNRQPVAVVTVSRKVSALMQPLYFTLLSLAT